MGDSVVKFAIHSGLGMQLCGRAGDPANQTSKHRSSTKIPMECNINTVSVYLLVCSRNAKSIWNKPYLKKMGIQVDGSSC